MRTILHTLLICGVSCSLSAQQEQMYTQFMYNKLTYNPGYAGSFESPTLTVIDRHQWIGFEGAPNAQVINYTQATLNRRVGLGLGLSHQGVGITRTITVEGAYAYRIPFKRGYLGLGIQVSVRNYAQNWADKRIVAGQDSDSYIPGGEYNKFVPNFGAGLYYQGYRWFMGVSAPRILSNKVNFSDNGDANTKEVPHINAMGGVTLPLNSNLSITPQVLLRYVKGAPFDADVNGTLSYQKKYYVGLTYRTGGNRSGGFGESADILLGLQATKKLFVGASYDLGLSRLRTQQSGSVEVVARWWFQPPSGSTGKVPQKAPKPLF